jgi:hypothetical protein
MMLERNKPEPAKRFKISAAANYPMALKGRTIYVGCRRPPQIIAMDSDSGRQLTAIATAGDADDLYCDENQSRLYETCGAGFVEVLSIKHNGELKKIQHVRTGRGARTGLFLPDLHKLFVAVPQRPGQACQVMVYQTE